MQFIINALLKMCVRIIISQAGMVRQQTGQGTMPRVGEPEEIAQLALFLASDEASFVTGQVIEADAGWGAY